MNIIEIVRFKRLDRGGLIGVGSLRLDNEIVIHDVRLMTGVNGHFWLGPEREYVDKNGEKRRAKVVTVQDDGLRAEILRQLMDAAGIGTEADAVPTEPAVTTGEGGDNDRLPF